MTNSTLKWGLLVSVILNAFLLGVVTNFRGQPHGHPPPPDPDQMIEQMSQGLSASDAKILRQAFDQEHAFLQDDHGPQDLHKKIRAALLADPFDPNQLQSVFEEDEKSHHDHGAAIGRMIVTAAKQMSADGRHHLADFRPGPPGPPGPH